MITAVIIDDESKNSQYLRSLIETEVPEVVVRGTASDAEEGIRLIQAVKPSLVFLDIEMHPSNGFDLLSRIQPVDFSVIFVTAHERYALKAIRFAALDFLLKPVDKDELKAAVEKALQQQQENNLAKSMEVFMENLQKKNTQKKIAIKADGAMHVFEIGELIYCEGDGPYTTIYTTGRKVLSIKTLKEYDLLLNEHGFFRIHKSFLVNLDHIRQYSKSEGGYVIMSNGARIDVSEKKKAELVSAISSRVVFIS
jgi:two-component system LytT family response regulator